MLFQIQVEYTRKDYLALLRLDRLAKHRKRWILDRILTALMILTELALVYMIFFTRYYRRGPGPVLSVLFLLMPLFIARRLLWPRIQASKMLKNNITTQTHEMRFDETGAVSSVPGSVGQYSYDAFESIYHSQDVYYLYLKQPGVFILPERAFVRGDPAAFGAFLREMTGLEVREVK